MTPQATETAGAQPAGLEKKLELLPSQCLGVKFLGVRPCFFTYLPNAELAFASAFRHRDQRTPSSISAGATQRCRRREPGGRSHPPAPAAGQGGSGSERFGVSACTLHRQPTPAPHDTADGALFTPDRAMARVT